jgi:hypothetical protein
MGVITFMSKRLAVLYRTEEKCIQSLLKEPEGNRIHGKKLCAILKKFLQKEGGRWLTGVTCSEFGTMSGFS